MPATFLQQCDHAHGNATRNGSLGEPMVEHIRQNRYKHVWHPQIHIIEQTIKFRRLVEADLLQCITDFAFSKHTLATSRFSRPKAGEVGEIVTKLPEREISAAGIEIPKVRPKGVTYLTTRSQQTPVRGLHKCNVPIGEPSHFFFTCSCVRFHSFVGNSF